VQRTKEPCLKALKDSGLTKNEIGEVILVGGMSRMPVVQDLVKDLFGREPHKGVNPDEVVATGAAIQGGVLTGDVKDVLLLDVIPLTLGIETLGGVMTPLVERNTTIPVQKKQIFSTAADNQPAVTIVVLQGERPQATQNKEIGRFDLADIPPSRRGTPQIEVAFDVDVDGILHVSATDKQSGKEQKIRIEASSGLDESEIDRMVKEAELHREDDKSFKEAAEVRNEADSLVFRAEKALEEYKDKIPEDVSQEITSKVEAVKKALEGTDGAAIKAATDELNQHMQKIGEIMAQAAGQAGPGAEAPGAGAGPEAAAASEAQGSEDIEEAEVEILSDDEKKS
jgi:molecular chaperone DnaK